jgi:hypothetical protein
MLDSFTIRPQAGSLGVADLLAALRRSRYVVELPRSQAITRVWGRQGGGAFAVCAAPDRARTVAETVNAGGTLDEYHGLIATLDVTPESIYVYQLATPGVVAQTKALLVPLLRAQPCRVFSETAERTADFTARPELLFDAKPPTGGEQR